MTKRPHENWNVRGIEGPKYKVSSKCSIAICGRYADHVHHMWSRKFLTGDFKWVELWDGRIVQNLTGLCVEHHRQITENEARIAFEEDGFQWFRGDENCVLVPQPKGLAEFSTALQISSGEVVPHEDAIHEREEPSCPTCGHRRRRASDLPPGEKRNRVSWTVSVPKDDRENGASVLDELALACAEKLGRADHASYKYYTLVDVLATFALGNIEVDRFVSE